MDTKKLLGLKIREIRRSRKITQEKLSEIIDMDNGYISKVEAGQNFPSLKTLEKIASVLDVELVDFFHFTQDKEIDYKSEINKIYDRLNKDMQYTLYKVVKSFE